LELAEDTVADLTQPITNMTLGDLRNFTLEVIGEDQPLWGKKEGLEGEALAELLEAMRNHIMVLPPSVKSNLELLREDRDR
jgi:hypothetical protein